MKKLLLGFFALTPTLLFANCNIAEIGTLESVDRNGLYYSTSGDEKDAFRVPLVPINSNPTELTASSNRPLPYSSKGRFFIKTGVNGDAWLNLNVPLGGEEAIAVTSQTQSNSIHDPQYVSVYRDTIPAGTCFVIKGTQEFFAAAERRHTFVKESEFSLFHALPVSKQSHDTLEEYHFAFGRKNARECIETREVFTQKDGKRMLVTSDIYNTWPREGTPPRAVARIASEIGSEFAGIIIGSPAYARTGPEVSSLMSSLHYLTSGEACFGLPAPVPTGAEAGYWREVFLGVDAHRRKSEELAESGEFSPTVTEMVLKKVVDSAKAGFIRVHWASR